ncbi:uncharacterized protein ACB058_020464 [Synchiropus picturatus]
MFFRRLLTSCLLLSLTESSEVIWSTVGGSATIRCRISSPKEETLKLLKGLMKENVTVYKSSQSHLFGCSTDLQNRLTITGVFPNHDIHISNLRLSDTSVYWCTYRTFDSIKQDFRVTEANSVTLLVVPARPTESTGLVVPSGSAAPVPTDHCHFLVLVAVGISSAVLITILLLLLACIIKKKLLKRVMAVPRCSAADVYEEMRATVRR